MYIKIFESRETAKSYTVVYPVMNATHVSPYLENENHVRITVTENELYQVLDKLFKDKNACNSKQMG